MGSNYTGLSVTWIDESSGYVDVDNITDDVLSIPIFTDTGSGEVNEAEIVLSAKGGKYITTGSKIDKFDRISISISDLNGNSYDRTFEVVEIIPSQTKGEGSILTLRCLGIEYHLQGIHYSKRDWFRNGFFVAQNIGDVYNSNRGSRQPTLQYHNSVWNNSVGNDLPTWTNNHYEFGSNEESCYNRLMDLTTLLGGAVTNGGVGEFFELGVDTPSATVINLALFTSGSRTWDGNNPSNDASGIIIKNTTSVNVSEQEGGIANPTGTKVASWGSPMHGSLPLGTAKYRAHELEFAYRPQWKSGIKYKEGAKVVDGSTGKHYKATSYHTGNASTGSNITTDYGRSPSWWTIIDMKTEFGDTVQYSEWTDNKAKLWANSGSNPDAVTSIPAWTKPTSYTIGDLVSNGGNYYVAVKKHSTVVSSVFATDLANNKWEQVDEALKGNGASFFDINTVIKDDGIMFRTWVHEVVGDTNYDGTLDAGLSNEYLHDAQSIPPMTHRFLNVGNVASGLFASSPDVKGRSTYNAVCQFYKQNIPALDTYGYHVLYAQPTSSQDKMQVFDIKDRKIWEWSNSVGKWLDKTGDTVAGVTYRNDENAHEWKSIYNIQGSDPRPTTTNTTPINETSNNYNTNIRSAVEVCYQFGTVANLFVSSSADAKKGAWLNFGFPFPISSYNGISENVGDIYGGGTNESSTGVTYPFVFDTQNMSYTSDGKLGFNNSTSEELGSVSSLSFNMRVVIDDVSGNRLGGIVTVRCWLLDIHDNIVYQDFDIKFTDYIGVGKGFQSVDLALGGFSPYRGRQPKNHALRFLGSLAGFEIPIQELDNQDIFRFHEIKYIGFQVQDFYDDEGRFDPQRNMMDMTNTGTFADLGGTIRMAVDAFHWKKVLLAITDTQSTINIEPQFMQRPNIISYLQLKNEVNSQLEIEQFRHKEYNFQTSGNTMFDVRFGDTFFLNNSEIVDDADYQESTLGAGDGTANHIRLVAKRIEYHLTKPRSGVGGITRSIKGIKRFVS